MSSESEVLRSILDRPKYYEIGTRVIRTVTDFNGRGNDHTLRGVVVGVKHLRHYEHEHYTHTILWDGRKEAQGGYFTCGLEPEEPL